MSTSSLPPRPLPLPPLVALPDWQALYVYVPKYESGGVFWFRSVSRLVEGSRAFHACIPMRDADKQTCLLTIKFGPA